MRFPGSSPRRTILAITAVAVLITAASGLRGAFAPERHSSAVGRAVFGNIASPMRLAFYLTTIAAIVALGLLFAARAANWDRGTPEARPTRRDNFNRRLSRLWDAISMRTVNQDPVSGVIHGLIYWPFLVLLAVTTTLEIDHSLPEAAKFLHGTVYQGYSLVGDVAGLLFLVGVVAAIVRRFGSRPFRLRTKTRSDDVVTLSLLVVMGATGLLVEAARIALDGRPEFERWSVVGWPLSSLFDDVGPLPTLHQSLWLLHVASFLAFLIAIPVTKLRHMITSPVNMYLSDRDRPKGAMRPVPGLLEGEVETVGASRVTDFTWKQLFDTDACTVCGRCTDVCPAQDTGKPLDPREIVLKVGQVMAESGEPVLSPTVSHEPLLTVSSSEIFQRITPEEIWACTSCKACDEVCPVDIEIMDKILDMRRHLSLMESDFPDELGSAYVAMENSENPWGMPQAERAAWARDLPTEVQVVDVDGPFTSEYLMWVGCAGSFDDRNQKVTVATATLLHRAGIDVAILGPRERCTGDPARRTGNEYLFQQLATQNVTTLNGLGVRKIVTQCPHCFNTLANEYPQLGGNYEVVHHSQLLSTLIADGRLDVSASSSEGSLVYHDACYLARHNDETEAPRRVVGSLGGIKIMEAPRNGSEARCCGAGGGRMWMEENVGERINNDRARELISTGADQIATACPFCAIMIGDGVAAQGSEVQVKDIAVHLLESLPPTSPSA